MNSWKLFICLTKNMVMAELTLKIIFCHLLGELVKTKKTPYLK